MILNACAVLATGFAAARAQAQIQTQPTEIIRATPLTSFSERAGSWPASMMPAEAAPSDIVPLEHRMNTAGGVQMRRSGSPTLSIRGSAQGARTLRLFDSVPLVLADGFGAPDALIPTELSGELRLVKGPSSVFYGPYAMAGALNHLPRVFERSAIRLGAGDQGGGLSTTNAFAVLPIHSEGSDGGFVQASLFTENRPNDFPFESVSSGIRGRRWNNKSQTNRYTALGEHSLGSWRFRERIVHADTAGTNPERVTTPLISNFVRHSTLAAFDARATLGRRSELGVQTSHVRHFSRDLSAALDSSSEASRSLLALDYAFFFTSRLRSRTFADVSYDALGSRGFFVGSFSQSALEFGQIVEIPLSGRWTLQPGARWLARHGRIFSSFALIHENDVARAWLTYSEGFRAPSLYDRFASASSVVPNPGLRPETSRQIELGAFGKPDVQHRTYIEGFTWNAAVFGVEYDRFFDNQQVSPGATTKVNRGEAYAYGADLGIGFAKGSRAFSVGYSYLEGRNRATREELTLSPRHHVSAAATQGLGPALFELRQTYASRALDREFPSNKLRSLGDWSSLDFGLRTLGLTNWEFKAGLINLFDRPRELTLGFPEPQRTFYVSALRHL